MLIRITNYHDDDDNNNYNKDEGNNDGYSNSYVSNSNYDVIIMMMT